MPAFYLLASLFHGKDARAEPVAGHRPWNGRLPRRPPEHNFLELPIVMHGPYELRPCPAPTRWSKTAPGHDGPHGHPHEVFTGATSGH